MYCEPCKNKFLRGEVDTNATEEAPDMSDGAKVLADESASAPETTIKAAKPKKKKKKKKIKKVKKMVKEKAAQSKGEGVDRTKYPVISYEEIVRGEIPEGFEFDSKQKEKYLTEDDFEDVFKMHRKDYEALKPWKKKRLKKDLNLF